MVSGKRRRCALFCTALILALFSSPVFAQDESSSTDCTPEPEHNRIFGIIPNYRTSPSLKDYKPLTPKEKFTIAAEDSFDRGTFMLAAGFGGEAQFFNSSPSFGHGIRAYARYAAASYVDWSLGNVMTEAIYPVFLRQDPRYFRRGEGSNWSRVKYAVGQILWTHADSGRTQFNFSEVVGNSTAVAISNIYYPDNRTVADGASRLAVQIGVDMVSNLLKEFSPDWECALARKHRSKGR
jgi:hypothetical protein